MRRSLSAVLSAGALSWGGLALAQTGTVIVPEQNDRVTTVGTRGANFLSIGIGARALGMAGAAVASVDGPQAVYWNPSNVVAREGLGLFASHMRMYGNSGISTSAGAVSVPVGAGAVALSVQQFSSGEMERTTERAPTGDDPVFPGTFTFTGIAVAGHYARNITDRLTAAIGGRWAQDGIDFARSSQFGLDIATRFRTGLYGLTVAGTLANVGGVSRFRGAGVDRSIQAARNNNQATGRDLPVSFDTREVKMPTTFRLGIHSSVFGDQEALFGRGGGAHRLTAEVDFTQAIDADLQTAVGAEYGLAQTLFLRAGKRFFNESHAPWTFADGLSFGGGLRVPIASRRITLDYAYVTMGELRNNQVLSFDFDL